MLEARTVLRRVRCHVAWCIVAVSMASGCNSPKAYIRAAKENEALRRQVDTLSRNVAAGEAVVVELRERITNLESFATDRPADLFAPTSIEIINLSGGENYNDQPGDDGITVHLRPRDADGDVVKAPGRITVQLLDNTNLAVPRVVGVRTFDQPEALRRLWHGRFMTNHYTLRCPFTARVPLPISRRITVSVSFVEYQTGRTLTAVKEVSFVPPPPTKHD